MKYFFNFAAMKVTKEAQLPLVSVIIPMKNAEKYLSAALDSALALNDCRKEIIVVDDGSEDSSANIAGEYASVHPEISVYSILPSGPGPARQYGFEKSKGEFVTFLDADDRLHPMFVTLLLNLMEKDRADIAAAPMTRVNSDTPIPQLYRKNFITKTFTGEEAVADGLYQLHIDCSTCSKIYRREIIENINFPEGRYEDLALFPDIFLRAKKVVWISEPLYLYTLNPESFISSYSEARLAALDVTENIVREISSSRPSLLKAAEDRALSAAFNIFNLLQANGLRRHEVEERCKHTIRRYRRGSLINPRVRLKNKLGILVTFIGGFGLLRCIARRSAT